MLPLYMWTAVFVVSLFVLIKASGHFTDSAEKIGIFLGVPPFIVGVTIVAVGTSLPELVSSVVAVIRGSSEIVAGNVVGSNVTNIFLIVGVSAIAGKKFRIEYELIHVDLPLLVGSAFLLAATVWDGIFTLPEALLSLAGFVFYSLYVLNVGEGHVVAEAGKRGNAGDEQRDLDRKTLALLAGSALFIYLGARYTVESIIMLSDLLGIGKEIIAASAVALGTSLPELMVSITAAKSGRPEMAIGNVLGSNIFNAFAVMGISALFGTLVIPQSILSFALPLMLAGTLLYLFITQDKQITQWEGWMLLLFYIFFIGRLLGWL